MQRTLRKRTSVNYKEGLCGCNPQKGTKCDLSSGCLNRTLKYFCTDESCGSGTECKNRKEQASQIVEIKETKRKGYGIFATRNITEGTYILQCKGRKISDREFLQHHSTTQEKADCTFFVRPGTYLDMCKGNIARFLNHSCDPNADVDKMIKDGFVIMTITANRPIKKDEEITISYSKKPQGFVCQCEVCYSKREKKRKVPYVGFSSRRV